MHHSFRNTQYLRLNGKAQLKQLLSGWEKWLLTVVEVSIICSYGSCLSPRTTCAWEGGDGPCHSRSPRLKENMYNHDGGFPLRIIIQQLQEEAKYLSVLTLPDAEAPLGHRKSLLVQSLLFWTRLTFNWFFAFLLGLVKCKIKTVLATGLCGRGAGTVGKGFFFFFKLIRHGELNCLLSALSSALF